MGPWMSGMITSKSPGRFFPCLRDTIRSLPPRCSFENDVPLSSETVADKFPNHGIVVDDEDGHLAGLHPMSPMSKNYCLLTPAQHWAGCEVATTRPIAACARFPRMKNSCSPMQAKIILVELPT